VVFDGAFRYGDGFGRLRRMRSGARLAGAACAALAQNFHVLDQAFQSIGHGR